MAINQIGGFNPYVQSVGVQRPTSAAERSQPEQLHKAVTSGGDGLAVADAIKQNATERLAAVQSNMAPAGVDQDLWSVLTKDERNFFVKMGGFGGLTYGQNASAVGVSNMPIARGSRLDIRA